MKLIFSFLPWIVYGVLSQFIPHVYSAIIGLVFFIAIGEISHLKKGFIISWLIIITLLLTIIINIIPTFPTEKLYQWIIMNVSFAAVSWGSIIFRVPFSIQYAKERVPQDKWNTPLFIKVNYIITLIWALVFTFNSVISYIDNSNSDIISTISIIIAAILSKKIPEFIKKRDKLYKN